jgi:hypothetical protein
LADKIAFAGVAAEAESLQVADGVGAALVLGDDVVHLQGPLVLVRAAALAGWSMWLMRMRSAMDSRRRWYVVEGGWGIGESLRV